MKEILAKISSYDIFNNLVPGAVFIFLLAQLEIYTMNTKNMAVDLIVFYFAGMVISRIGSLTLEPFLKWVGFIQYATYVDFMKASKNDDKIATLLEINNQYRTFATMMLVVLCTYFGQGLISYWSISAKVVNIWLILATAVIFLMAFRKQTTFVRNRVEHYRQP